MINFLLISTTAIKVRRKYQTKSKN